MPELHVDAVIFDMDGVAIDSGDVYARHWRAWGAGHGIDYAEVIAPVHPGRPATETVRVVAPHLDAVAEAARFNATLASSGESAEATPMPGAAALFAALPHDRWAIATSGVRAVAGAWLRDAGLPEPAVFVTIDDVERGKPAPDPFLRAAALLGFEPGRCLVVEDAPAGIRGAKAAGATVLALLTTHEATDLGEADHRTGGLEDVTASFDGEQLRVEWRDVS